MSSRARNRARPRRELDRRVEKFLSDRPALASARVATLAGDASNRCYYRIHLKGGGTEILALLPEPFVPEELPFLEVSSLLRAIPVRVPELREAAGGLGILLLEDLGDNLLQEEARSGSAARKRQLYREAIEILVRMQSRGRELSDRRYLPFRIAFDEKKFFDELDFFRAHFVSGLLRRKLSDAERGELDECFHALAAELQGLPYVLCHRDYHSRNLIVCDAELAVIDFQDARMGPRCYDLVSLLNDSYVAHAEGLVSEMKEIFSSAVGCDLAMEYDVAALQRNLKALGTFGFQIDSRGNHVYRGYVEPTIALVRANLERNPRWDRLRRALARHLPELG